MKTNYKSILKKVAVSTAILTSATSFAQEKLWYLGSYNSGSGVGAAEIVSYDKKDSTLYMINGAEKAVELLNASNPFKLEKIANLDISKFASGEPTSVAVKGDLVAVAIPDSLPNGRGVVAFFDRTTSSFIDTVTVGYLPDMVTFTPDGTKVLTANEGEPSDDYTIDPVGSISIIDVTGDLSSTVATEATFDAWIGKENHLRNKEIRIFGNNGLSNAAQDLEPEYITISEDNKTAYVACQENNALAVVDIATSTVVDILSLGLKDHASGKASLEKYILNELVQQWPDLGIKPTDGRTVKLGGFSGLWYAHNESSANNLVFYTIPDRGPNADHLGKIAKYDGTGEKTTQNARPFLLPNYTARIVKFSVDTTAGTVTLENDIPLNSYDGTTPITGRGNIPNVDEVPVAEYQEGTAQNTKDFYTVAEGTTDTTFYSALEYDPHGGDFEGILIDKEGNFWMCDEYRPAIYKFDNTGKMLKRFISEGANEDYSAYGDTELPSVYNKRRANRGFEAIAYDSVSNTVYAFIQSPMYNPSSSVKDQTDAIRILGIDAMTGAPKEEFVYLLTANQDKSSISNRVDKIGDAVYVGKGRFWVIERDSDFDTEFGQKYIYEINLTGATNILDTDESLATTSPTLEEMSADELVAAGIQPVFKRRVLNLPTLGYRPSDKAEGLVRLANGSMAVINDNDFGLEGAGGTDNSVLGIISFAKNNGFDASNKADNIEIASRNTLGMYQPDGIASYTVDGKTYIVTANEGDARDYDGYSEEVRVKDLTYNTQFHEAEVTDETILSRLKTTTANGDLDNDGTYEYIYSYGARSFSIYDEKGNQVFDSNNDFEVELAKNYAEFLNAQYDDEDFEWKSAKNRSDDKGVEPEGVVVGKVNGKTFAFVGLERMGGVMVYDVSSPKEAKFVQFISTAKYGEGDGEENLKAGLAGDLAPEGLAFVSAEDSPIAKPLLFVANEVSGSVAVFAMDDEEIVGTTKATFNQTAEFFAFPTNATNSVNLSKVASGDVYDIKGTKVLSFGNTNILNTQNLTQGFYIIKTNEGLTSIFRIIE
ncbi:MAG: calcium-binding protein [Cytophagales bacterium]|nr:calcium-binding protein [Cytophagales bacterium]